MSYDAKFKDVKDTLVKVYASPVPALRTTLKIVRKIEIEIRFLEFAVTPSIALKHNGKYVEITDFFKFMTSRSRWTPSEKDMHIGYKRYDDFLGIDGKLIQKSGKFKRKLEYIRCDNSWLRWIGYKIKTLFVKP